MMNTLSIPSNFICPITLDIMRDPVVLIEDGHSYEKSALENWLRKNHTSPLTNKPLRNNSFVMNYNLKSAIEEYCHQQNEIKSKRNFQSFNLHRGRPRNSTWKNNPKLKIIISLLGPSNVGKSCLADNAEYGRSLNNYKGRVTLATDIFFFYLDQLFEDKYVVIIQVNDCPGDDKFESVSDRHFRNCHGAILIADATDMRSFERLEGYWYKRLREKSSFEQIETVLACNKIDLLEQNPDLSYREEFFKQATTFASFYQIPIFNISALRGDNVQSMFHHLISNILQNQILLENLKDGQEQPAIRTESIKLNTSSDTSKDNKKFSCCYRSTH